MVLLTLNLLRIFSETNYLLLIVNCVIPVAHKVLAKQRLGRISLIAYAYGKIMPFNWSYLDTTNDTNLGHSLTTQA